MREKFLQISLRLMMRQSSKWVTCTYWNFEVSLHNGDCDIPQPSKLLWFMPPLAFTDQKDLIQYSAPTIIRYLKHCSAIL